MSMITNLGAVVQAHPDRANADAVIPDPDSEATAAVSYRQLHQTVDRIARFLAASHTPGARVGVLGDNSVNYLNVILASARAGLVAVPMSPRQGAGQIAAVVREAQLAVVFAEPSQMELVKPLHPSPLPLSGAEFDRLDGSAALMREGGDEVAVQLYTSGSSGRPKGVLLSHSAFLFTLRAFVNRPAADGLRVLVAAPLFHMNGLITCLSVLAQGGTILLMRRFDAVRYLRAIELRHPSVLVGVPAMFAMAIDAATHTSPTDLRSVQAIVSGSAPLTTELLAKMREAFPAAQVHNSYGTTEAFGIFGPHPEGRPAPEGSVGVVQPGAEVRLVDGPSEREGRLLVRTPASMSGYHADCPAGSAPSRGGYHDTGDFARVDEAGFYYILGRADDLIICGGEKVYPGPLEELLEAHPAVRMAAVVPVSDARKGQVPVAFVVPAGGAGIDPDELTGFTLDHGPAYAHPRRIIVLDELPLTSTGKVDKKRLAALAGGVCAP